MSGDLKLLFVSFFLIFFLNSIFSLSLSELLEANNSPRLTEMCCVDITNQHRDSLECLRLNHKLFG